MSLTAEQKIALSPKSSIWVDASAGTGKTSVLTNRVLRLMLDGVPPGKILCITFTKAAATEMLSRINKRLSQWAIAEQKDLKEEIELLIEKNPDEKVIFRARQLFLQIVDEPEILKIQTIHSFCESLLKRFSLEADMNPHFQAIDERTCEELTNEAWERLLFDTASSIQKDSSLKKAIARISTATHDVALKKIINEVLGKRHRIDENFSEKDGVSKLIGRIYEKLGVKKEDNNEKIISENLPDSGAIKKILTALNEGGKTDKSNSLKLADYLTLNPEEKINNFENYFNIFMTKERGPRKLGDKKSQKAFPEIGELITTEQNRLDSVADKIKSLETARLSEDVVHITEALLVLYENLKKERNFIDFDDLIIKSLNLLNKPDIAPWIMYKMDDRIDHILVDEAQDTSPEQWKIIEHLSSEFFSGEGARDVERTLFVVGDRKQSIFSFQGADPNIFNERKNFFAKKIKDSKKDIHSVLLNLSFRSTEPVLKAVDSVFSDKSLIPALADLDTISHKSHRLNESGLVEMWPLTEGTEDNSEDEIWPLPDKIITSKKPHEVLAEQIAETIKKWLDDGRELKSKGRPVAAGDIMILVRKRGEFVDSLIKNLRINNIPVAGTDRMVLTDHIAIMDLITLGEFLLLPSDDLALATILKSPLIGINEEELFDLAYGRKDTLWNSLKEKRKNSVSYEKAYYYLVKLLGETDWRTPFDLYSEIIEVLDGRKLFIGRLGLEVNDPLNEFLELCLNYNNAHIPSLQGFLHWIQTSKAEIKRDFEHSNNEIRITTVHGAKGLESPVIFLPDTTQVPSVKENLFWDKENTVFWAGNTDNQSNLCKKLKSAKEKEAYDEYLRLLYVAMTRAEDELYICGWKNKRAKAIPEKSWYSITRRGLVKIGKEDSSGYIRISSEQKTPPEKPQVQEKDQSPVTLPDYLFRPAREEATIVSIAPSRQNESDSETISATQTGLYKRGKIIHSLLEILPTIKKEERLSMAEKFLEKEEIEEKDILIGEVLSVIEKDEFAEIFSSNSKAEVPVLGKIENHVISGKIDRLIIKDGEVIIIDYKTNRDVPASEKDVSVGYIRQMAEYRSILKKIFPDKSIKCALLWTALPKLMPLSENLLNNYTPP